MNRLHTWLAVAFAGILALPTAAVANHCDPIHFVDIGPGMGQPTGAVQLYSGNCSGSVGCNQYFDITLQAGQVVWMSFCSQGGAANWDTGFSAWDGASYTNNLGCVDDTCGLQTEAILTAPYAGTFRVRIGGFGGANGPYIMAWQAPAGTVIGGAGPIDSDNDGDPDVTDCADFDPSIYTGAPESCDLIDQDCDGDLVENFPNFDGDGQPDCVDIDDDNDGDPDTNDCAPYDPTIYANAQELCDQIDSDCDGSLVDGFANFDNDQLPDCVDLDDDNDGDPDATDCEDFNAWVYNGAQEFCDNLDSDCDGDLVDGYPDFDGDAEPDCVDNDDDNDGDPDSTDRNDLNALVFNGAVETCNGVDDDCDGIIDEGTPCFDDDGDGFTENTGDCDDGNATINPGAVEVCDGIDADCDGVVDDGTSCYDDDGDCFCEGLTCVGSVNASCSGLLAIGDCWDDDPFVLPGGTEVCDGVDGDCDGQVDEGTPCADDDGDGFSEDGGDCDDGDPLLSPTATETCDGIDADCDGIVDDGTSCYDDDGDCFCEVFPCVGGANAACGLILGGDCNDDDPTILPGGVETDDGVDQDCDGVVDDGLFDDDLDGDGYTEAGGDCDDNDADVGPAQDEDCDGADQDCDGVIDEGTDCFDDDGDGVTEDEGDCDDDDPTVFPGAEELCDGVDRDCNDVMDDVAPCFDLDGDGFSEDGGDCDDDDDGIYPGATEVCDGLDDDCDGEVDEHGDCVDEDGDGSSPVQGDCDDDNPWIGPDVEEVCDGLDNDCDGEVDPGCGDGEFTIDESPPERDAGCACGATVGGGGAPWLGLLLLPLLGLRRRRTWRASLIAPLLLLALALPQPGCNNDTKFVAVPGRLVLTPESLLDIGSTRADAELQASILVTNIGTREINIAGVQLRNDNGLFWIVDGAEGPLVAAQAREIVIGFSSPQPGAATAQLTAVFTGVGDDAAVHDWTIRAWAVPGDLVALPAVLDFGKVPEGGSNTAVIELLNVGSVPVAAENVTSLNPAFQVTPPAAGWPAEIEPGDSLNVAVTYLAAGAGAVQALLEVASTAPDTTIVAKANACLGSSHPSWNVDLDGFASCAGDCDDTNPLVHPAAIETCDGLDEDCDGVIDNDTQCGDDDGDGFTEDDGDCNDGDPSVYPGAPEAADGVDTDCDGLVPDDEGPDADGDGVAPDGGDCDDTNANIGPNAVETCDGTDQDCDGVIDEGTACFDDDGDGYDENGGDCDDGDPTVLPGVVDVLNGQDDDCDGQIDEDGGAADADGDGFTPNGGDCDDANNLASPASPEIPGNNIDDDCNGLIDG